MSELVKALRHTCDGCNPTPCCEFEALGPEAADTIDRLTAELTEYRAIAAEYGIDGKTMLALAKSQIETAKENAALTERLAAVEEDINRCMTLLEKIHGHWPCELCSKDGKCVTCHPVWRGEVSE